MSSAAGPPLRLGTRTSRLALWQAEHVAAGLRAAWPGLDVELVPFVTEGDRTLGRPLPEIGGKGLFTAELEAALLDGRIDLAVHSLKDLPTDDPAGLAVGAITERDDPRDALVGPAGPGSPGGPGMSGTTFAGLRVGAVVGTSSLRRSSQLLRCRPDLDVRSIRGAVETRIRKVDEGGYDATVLACAGLLRLGLAGRMSDVLTLDAMLPAPGQAALAVQVRAGDAAVREAVAALDHAPTRAAVTAERAFLSALGGGCSAPIAAFAEAVGGRLHLRGRVARVNGTEAVDVAVSQPDAGPGTAAGTAAAVGQEAAEAALSKGARALLT